MRRVIQAAAVLALAGSLPILAHHAFFAEFDPAKPITLSGTVTKVEWLNPHARFHLAVKDGTRTRDWEWELASPNGLIRQGWNREYLKTGDVVTVKGYRAKDGSSLAAARYINFADGRSLTIPTAGDGGPDK